MPWYDWVHLPGPSERRAYLKHKLASLPMPVHPPPAAAARPTLKLPQQPAAETAESRKEKAAARWSAKMAFRVARLAAAAASDQRPSAHAGAALQVDGGTNALVDYP